MSSSNFPPISPGGGSNISLSNSSSLQTTCRVGNAASASATNQSNPPTPNSTDQNATTSPNRKNSKKVMISANNFSSSALFCQNFSDKNNTCY
jgi:hypothetical protein